MKHLSDQELMAVVQGGDYSPASEIYDRYSARIYNFAFRFLKNAEAAEKARKAGLDAVMDRCVKIEHGRLFGGLSWVGVNTRVISAKRPRWLAY